MSITVLIPTHGRPTLLERTLRSLAECHLPAGYCETVVVENGSRAGAETVVAEIAEAHPALQLRYLHVERANKSHALNEALATVDDGLVVFFDDDVRLDPGVLEAYAEAAEAHPERAYFGGSVQVDYEERPPEWLIPFFPHSARGNISADGKIEIYLGANWGAYAQELLSFDGFDPQVGPGSSTGGRGQETNMQDRLEGAGFVAVPVLSATAWHYVPGERASPEWLIRRWYQVGLSYGQWIAQGYKENSIPRAVANAIPSLVKLPIFYVLYDRRRILGHKIKLYKTIGLVKGYLVGRREVEG